MKTAVRIPFLLACAALMTTVLAGCHATVDARWATMDDTVYHWERAVPKLPIEVRGQLPNASNEQIARAIPNANPAPSLASAGNGHAAGDTAQRLVVEVGNHASPNNDAYCATPTEEHASTHSESQLAITLTICDGTRLVASSRSPLDPNKTTVDDLPRKIDRLKTLALIGISRSPAQYTQTQS
ncbi:hypothetical protein [Dyella sp. 20L07]|uniref:hypothetical protein n=1 Tax=Dyella sp. 20L07 TaxID=3384240 RepID=UPI003D28E9C8